MSSVSLDFDSIIRSASDDKEQTVGMSFVMPVSLKKEFEDTCRSLGLPMASVMRSMMIHFIELTRVSKSNGASK